MNWFNEFLNKYKAGISHEFVFHFNTKDIVDNTRLFDKYMVDEFITDRKFGIIAFYDISTGLRFWDPAMGREFRKVVDMDAPNLFDLPPSKLFPLIDIALKNTKMVLFINHAETLIPTGDIATLTTEERISLIWICEWSLNGKISAVGSTIFLMADNIADINREIQKSSYRIEPILVELPNETQRKEFIEFLTQDRQVKMELSTSEFSKLSSGLSKKSIKDIKLKAEAEGVPISFEFIKEKKHSVLQKEYGDVLEFIYPEIDFNDIGGMEAVKKYLTKNVIEPIKTGDLRRVPMGILLCGPSGTGRTLLVNALQKKVALTALK
jgi:hypothetical protein